jgi:hypothetical protein
MAGISAGPPGALLEAADRIRIGGIATAVPRAVDAAPTACATCRQSGTHSSHHVAGVQPREGRARAK